MRAALLLVSAAPLVLALPASAVVHPLQATLDGLQEVPPNASPATGFASLFLDDVANTLTISLTFGGLLGSQTAAHVHGPAAPGSNAGILVGLPLGTFVSQVLPITDTIEGHVLAGLTYINVHTPVFPGGGIRGQVVQAPVSVETTPWGAIKALYR
jgi:hypothetical protein